MNKYFITGTNTGVGKTYIACKLLEYFNKSGRKTMGLKPVASDSTFIDGDLKNDDALKLQMSSSVALNYNQVNPFVFKEPWSPDIAARVNNTPIFADDVISAIKSSWQEEHDYCFIEGVGGWRVPINDAEYMSDVVKLLDIPTIIVVSIELGSINHTLLTIDAIKRDNVVVAGWVANIISNEGMDFYNRENIQTLKNHIKEPLLAVYSNNLQALDNLSYL